MATALIFAGGTGQRMNSRAKPKQFLELHGKPIIIYTLEHFEEHPEIDKFIIVCLEEWIEEMKFLLKQYNMRKTENIVPGGSTGHESIYCGLRALEGICNNDDIVLIHDGVRPLITPELISDNIAKVKETGIAITVESVTESVVQIDKKSELITKVPPRAEMYIAKAPQSFRYGIIWNLYQRAHNDGILAIDSSHLCSYYKIEMYAVKSTPYNIKITTPQDYYIFRALFEAIESQQILGI